MYFLCESSFCKWPKIYNCYLKSCLMAFLSDIGNLDSVIYSLGFPYLPRNMEKIHTKKSFCSLNSISIQPMIASVSLGKIWALKLKYPSNLRGPKSMQWWIASGSLCWHANNQLLFIALHWRFFFFLDQVTPCHVRPLPFRHIPTWKRPFKLYKLTWHPTLRWDKWKACVIVLTNTFFAGK